MEINVKTFSDLKIGDIIYEVDNNSGYSKPLYIITKIISRDTRVSFECKYYQDGTSARYSTDIFFPKSIPYCINRNTIYLSDNCLGELCRFLVSIKVQCMAEKFNDLFGGLFKIDD